jgi:starch phosphorylase
VNLYLLDSNDPLNGPWERGITANLYPGEKERRLIQEIVLGYGGWRALEAMGIDPDICHINEGHAAFVTIARAVSFMRRNNCPFETAWWATRAGNVFTTHTPVAAGFDRFEPELIAKYGDEAAKRTGLTVHELIGLGRRDPNDGNEPFNMAFLALRGSAYINAVSQLHAEVSKKLFQDLFPRWPQHEIPVFPVTNGVHIPSWHSSLSHRIWARQPNEESPTGEEFMLAQDTDDADIWQFRAESRNALVQYVRRRLVRQVRQQGESPDVIARAHRVLDPNTLTLGFARRFAEYKRPTLLLTDPERFARILLNTQRPVQIIVAGKAHPNDLPSKKLVKRWADFASRLEVFEHVVFLEGYDIALARELAAGVDVWVNNPRRPWEACGTSGMKVLANGGLNFSALDGWWAEAYEPEVGWAIGDGLEHGPEHDLTDAESLYSVLEQQIVPQFYTRDEAGVPTEWVKRVRASMAKLTPQFSSARMLHEYVELAYLPAADEYNKRAANGAEGAEKLRAWSEELMQHWEGIRFGDIRYRKTDAGYNFNVQVFAGDLSPDTFRVELYADPNGTGPARVVMERAAPIAGAINAHTYVAEVPPNRPPEHYTVRLVGGYDGANIPLENALVHWQK